MARRFQDIWKDQCEAAEGIAAAHGKVVALDYLIGEKLDNYAQAAATPEFARELPRFVAAVRQIFSTDDIAAYFEAIEEDAGIPNTSTNAAELEESWLLMSVAAKQARIRRLQVLKAMLLAGTLGTA